MPKQKTSSSRTSRSQHTATNPRSQRRKDPKASHLYTDDNPSTTLHGTGFKDADTARRTISLVSRRSLTYQWQVINTMYHRAKGHPSVRKGDKAGDIKEAIAIFQTWLDDTYPDARTKRKEEGREFKPLLKKEVVQKYLERIRALGLSDQTAEGEPDDGVAYCQQFAELYAGLPKGKRLANVLLDDAHPEQEDWEIKREKSLVALNERRNGSGEEGLWNEKGGASDWHLQCIAWAWSPVGQRRLPP